MVLPKDPSTNAHQEVVLLLPKAGLPRALLFRADGRPERGAPVTRYDGGYIPVSARPSFTRSPGTRCCAVGEYQDLGVTPCGTRLEIRKGEQGARAPTQDPSTGAGLG